MREFGVSVGNQTLANQPVTLAFLNPAGAPNPNIEFLRFWVSQSTSATSAQQRVQLETQPTSFPTLVSATPTKRKPADPNASIIVGGTAGAAGTCGVNASAEGSGTKVSLLDDAFNVLNGWLHIPTPPETITMPAASASGLGLFFPAAASNLGGWAFGFIYREV
jgi:hypothetical protein